MPVLQIVITVIALFCAGTVIAKPESEYRDAWCLKNGGEAEVTMPDRTRCDCVTDTHAIEFDHAEKWYQAVGQALYYSFQTEKKAGIVLIVESEKDLKYWIRLNSTIQHFHLPIDAWITGDLTDYEEE